MTGPLRLAFAGQQTFFEQCALHADGPEVTTAFFDHRAGRDAHLLRQRLEAFAPDAIVVFRPETLPPGALVGLDAPVLGFLTEPISRTGAGTGAHWDLEKRRRDLAMLDPANVTRVVSFDPMIVETAEQYVPIWKSLPLPVDDRVFGEATPITGRPRMIFIGRSTLHREEWLLHVKHRFDCTHVAFGLHGDALVRTLRAHDVTFNVHNEPYPSFENRVLLHLAAGHLVITEPLDPTHGFVAGRDYLEARSPQEMTELAQRVVDDPAAFHAIRVAGREQAETVRASRVWPALVREMLSETVAA